MQGNRRTSIIVVGGALAIASIGYGLGTQADDGTAVAGSGSEPSTARGLAFEHGPPPGFSNLADTLGVDADELGDALRNFHEQERAERRDEFAGKLADALGVDADKVETALARQEDRMRRHMEKEWKQHQQELAEFLAERFDLDADKVTDALADLPRPAPHPHPGRPGPGGPGAFGPAR